MHPTLGLVGLYITPGTNDILFQEPHPVIPPLACSGLDPKTIGLVRPARPPHYSHDRGGPSLSSVSLTESQCSVCSPSLTRPCDWLSSPDSTPLFWVLAPSGDPVLRWLVFPLRGPGTISADLWGKNCCHPGSQAPLPVWPAASVPASSSQTELLRVTDIGHGTGLACLWQRS